MREESLEDFEQMAMFIGRNRKARVTYGFDEIALVPGQVTINPNEVDITFEIQTRTGDPLKLGIPILSSVMDGVVEVPFSMPVAKRTITTPAFLMSRIRIPHVTGAPHRGTVYKDNATIVGMIVTFIDHTVN